MCALLMSKAPRLARRGITQFYLPSTRLFMYIMSHPALTLQPQSITVLWSVLISLPAEGRRLSFPMWLGEILRWFARHRVASSTP